MRTRLPPHLVSVVRKSATKSAPSSRRKSTPAQKTVRVATAKANKNKHELPLMMWFIRNGYPRPVREYRFATDVGREYRFDFAWPDLRFESLNGYRLAIEIEGGGENGAHMRTL